MLNIKYIAGYLLLVLALFTALPFSTHAQDNPKQPNFLFIAVDDLNVYNTMMSDHKSSFLRKVYPNDKHRADIINKLTPNLAALAQKGTSFNKVYSAAPLCGPSRTSLMTGVPPHVSGYYRHDRHFRHYESLTKVVTLPQYLKQNGYFTTGVGKVFHKGRSYFDQGLFNDWPDQLYSWDQWLEMNVGTNSQNGLASSTKETLSPHYLGPKKSFKRFGKTEVETRFSNDYRNMQHVADLLLKGESTRKDVNRQEKTVRLDKSKPFFIAGGIFAPHLPFVVEQKYFDLFPQKDMAINQELLDWLHEDTLDLSKGGKKYVRQSSFVRMLNENDAIQAGDGLKAFRDKFQAYLATIAYADTVIGVLLDAIEKNPQKDNTVVILWSDHGYHLGDKLREGKVTLWEAANLANLLIIDPRVSTNKASKTEAIVSLQDLYPTIATMAGLPIPKHVYGQSLTPLVKDKNADWRNAVINTNQENNHALRTSRYRYIKYEDGSEELYDMKEDPLELTNIVDKNAYQQILEEHRQQLSVLLSSKY